MAAKSNSSLLTFLAIAFLVWLVYQGILKSTPTSELIGHSTAASFAKDIQSKPVVLVDFWATWCGPCRAMVPDLNAIAQQYEGQVSVYKLDVDEVPDIAAAYAVQYLPTIMIFKQGEELNRSEGLQSKKELASRLDAALAPQ